MWEIKPDELGIIIEEAEKAFGSDPDLKKLELARMQFKLGEFESAANFLFRFLSGKVQQRQTSDTLRALISVGAGRYSFPSPQSCQPHVIIPV